MRSTDETGRARPATLAFVNCNTAETVGMAVHLTPGEFARLRGLLDALRDYGAILRADLSPTRGRLGFADAVETLRASIGPTLVDSALAGGRAMHAGSEPAPAAVMPVWAFEPEGEGEDVLLGSGRLFGADLLIEALRVEDVEDPVPVASVRARHARWLVAAAVEGPVAAARLPGWKGWYAIFAVAATV